MYNKSLNAFCIPKMQTTMDGEESNSVSSTLGSHQSFYQQRLKDGIGMKKLPHKGGLLNLFYFTGNELVPRKRYVHLNADNGILHVLHPASAIRKDTQYGAATQEKPAVVSTSSHTLSSVGWLQGPKWLSGISDSVRDVLNGEDIEPIEINIDLSICKRKEGRNGMFPFEVILPEENFRYCFSASSEADRESWTDLLSSLSKVQVLYLKRKILQASTTEQLHSMLLSAPFLQFSMAWLHRVSSAFYAKEGTKQPQLPNAQNDLACRSMSRTSKAEHTKMVSTLPPPSTSTGSARQPDPPLNLCKTFFGSKMGLSYGNGIPFDQILKDVQRDTYDVNGLLFQGSEGMRPILEHIIVLLTGEDKMGEEMLSLSSNQAPHTEEGPENEEKFSVPVHVKKDTGLASPADPAPVAPVENGSSPAACSSSECPRQGGHLSHSLALQFAIQILAAGCRTEVGGNSFDAVNFVFQNKSLQHIYPDSSWTRPVIIRINHDQQAPTAESNGIASKTSTPTTRSTLVHVSVEVTMQFLLVPARANSPVRTPHNLQSATCSEQQDGIEEGKASASEPKDSENEAAQWDGVVCIPVTYSHYFDINVQAGLDEEMKTQGHVSIGPLGIPDR